MEARTSLPFVPQKGFHSTHWTIIQASAGSDAAAAAAREQLCRDYWYPVYAHLRRSGQQEHDAKDLAQDFFAHVLGRPWLAQVDRRKGRFRSYLLTSLDNFLKDDLRRKGAYKRGGAFTHMPLDLEGAADRYAETRPDGTDPQAAYEVEWAGTIVAMALCRLEAEHEAAGKQEHYRCLRPFMTAEGAAQPYEAAARALRITLENVKVSVHRLRKRFGSILREEVSRTVSSPDDVDEEMRYIRRVLSSVAT